ncbi:CHAT domain-containing protein [Pseudarthrobacter sp. L1SW]|uniref:CHAT domain-containing protein n=1 Tax=Pseudarthrobacter sp. L1SW TaxID=2851598 RepID=UPI001E601399|nr:CHAT domain-containing protein [Pseudarthrobacter sp. L1SW]UEL29472.1 CHAT domain-containing protein [Pseudarthrobacter sp. L1SW]
MSFTNIEQLSAARTQWLVWVAKKLFSTRLDDVETYSISGLSDFTAVEKALSVIHIGLSHIHGVDDGDIQIRGYLEPELCTSVISQWRDSGFDPRISSLLESSWLTLLRLGRDLEQARTELLLEFYASPLGIWMRKQTTANLDPEHIDHGVLTYFSEHPDALENSLSLPQNLDFGLDYAESHLNAVLSLAQTNPEAAYAIFSPLELLGCYPDNDIDLWKDEALALASQYHHVYLSQPGGWPRPGPGGVPDWVIDSVRNRGARFSHSTSGFVPGWFITVESNEELNGIYEESSSLAFFLREENENILTIGFAFQLGDRGEKAHISYRYDMSDTVSLYWLQALLAIGIVRIDVYRLNLLFGIEYCFAFGSRLPFELINKARAVIQGYLESNQSTVKALVPKTTLHYLDEMSLIEKNLFENLKFLQRERAEAPNSPITSGYLKFLRVMHELSLDVRHGVALGLSTLTEAYELLRVSLTRLERGSSRELDLSNLGDGRAYVQFFQMNGFLNALVAYVDNDSQTHCYPLDFSGDIDTDVHFDDIAQCSNYYRDGLSSLSGLASSGIDKLVINPGPDAYNIPLHDAMLAMGFSEVSYTHSLSSLSPKSDKKDNQDVLVAGYADKGDRYLPKVELELSIVAKLYSSKPREVILNAPLPAIVHFAGHGYSGSSSFQVGMDLGPHPNDYLSASEVLLEADCTRTTVVFLSACSTGRADYGPSQLVDNVPMDVAFIEAGAQTVVSTSAPINDVIAGLFAFVFHAALRNEQSVWEAFLTARAAVSQGCFDESWHAYEEELRVDWPRWQEDLGQAMKVAPEDWRLFRLSGRHWA